MPLFSVATYRQTLLQRLALCSTLLQIPGKPIMFSLDGSKDRLLYKKHFNIDITTDFILILTLHHKKLHTSTFDARKTQVGAMSTGSILFREYLQGTKSGLKIYNLHISQKVPNWNY